MTDMAVRLKLDARDEADTIAAGPCVRLVAISDSSGPESAMFLTGGCRNVEEFEQAVVSLKDRMDELAQEARALFQWARSGEKAVNGSLQTVGEIWEAMEKAGNLEAMRGIFNELDPGKRHELANFVFTHKNVFKGAAALFSQHYDERGALLE